VKSKFCGDCGSLIISDKCSADCKNRKPTIWGNDVITNQMLLRKVALITGDRESGRKPDLGGPAK
jgi:hypothetical protein